MSVISPDFYREERVKARKEHDCCECRRKIRAGDRYVRISGRWDGDVATFKTCLRCDRLRSKVADRYPPDYPEEGPALGGLLEYVRECRGFHGTCGTASREVDVADANVLDRVRRIVAEQFNVPIEKVLPESRFQDDLGGDSLDQVEIVMEVEEEFDISIPDEDVEKVTTIAEAVALIDGRLGSKGG